MLWDNGDALARLTVKVVHVPYCFYPDPVGGTEVYVEGLCRHLQTLGVEVVVAAPGGQDARGVHGRIPVRRYAVSPEVGDLRELYGDGDPVAAAGFARILDDETPDLVHLHAFTRGASLLTVRAAKQAGLPVVFTYHTPTVTCRRGTLMRWGERVCDGVLRLHTCSACALHGLGVPKPLAMAGGALPRLVGEVAGRGNLSGGVWTALRTTELVALGHATVRRLLAEVDRVVVPAGWTQEVLVANGVPEDKIVMSPQGLDYGGPATRPGRADTPAGPLKVGFVGRLAPEKGLHVLVEAIRSHPRLAVVLDVYGIAQEGSENYQVCLREAVAADPRVRFRGAVPPQDVVSCLAKYDVVAVPSQGLETGPLAVLEAFAADVPVIGSNLGGISERVRHGVDGLLVTPGSLRAWAEALGRLATDRALRRRLRDGVRPPRSMADVAAEMMSVYTGVVTSARAGRP